MIADFTKEEQTLIADFRGLSSKQKAETLLYISFVIEQSKKEEAKQCEIIQFRKAAK